MLPCKALIQTVRAANHWQFLKPTEAIIPLNLNSGQGVMSGWVELPKKQVLCVYSFRHR